MLLESAIPALLQLLQLKASEGILREGHGELWGETGIAGIRYCCWGCVLKLQPCQPSYKRQYNNII